MPRVRDEELRQATMETIKRTALELMRQQGTAGLSLRAIAREMGVTAPAIYHYYPRLEDLITALLVDAFNSLGDAMAQAASDAQLSLGRRVFLALHAYRNWALAHPIQFALTYGSPIPGYEAPAEITVPLARRPLEVLLPLLYEAWQRGLLELPPEYQALPPSIEQHVRILLPASDAPPALMQLVAETWALGHGSVMLELYGHLGPMIGDPAAFVDFELRRILTRAGLNPGP